MAPRPIPLGRGLSLPLGSPTAMMGILNVTPDSFSDGGRFTGVDDVVRCARSMRADGVAVLDVGGESTRPGARELPIDEELARVIPVVRALVDRVGLPVSVDTRKEGVFVEAYAAGASMLNDVSGLGHDPALGPAAARTDAAVVLMHLRGTPETMAAHALYGDVVGDVRRELAEAVSRAEAAGLPRDRLLVDPGIGFAKNLRQNLELLARISELRDLDLPIVVGPSRKRFLGEITGRGEARDRDQATAAVVAHLAAHSVALVRVHDAAACRDALLVGSALGAHRRPAPGAAS